MIGLWLPRAAQRFRVCPRLPALAVRAWLPPPCVRGQGSACANADQMGFCSEGRSKPGDKLPRCTGVSGGQQEGHLTLTHPPTFPPLATSPTQATLLDNEGQGATLWTSSVEPPNEVDKPKVIREISQGTRRPHCTQI